MRTLLRSGGIACVLLWLCATPVASQLASLEVEYRDARDRYERILGERAELQDAYNRSLDQVRAARSSDDEGRIGSARAAFYTQARALEVFDRRLEEADQTLQEVGRELIRALDDEEEELLARLEGAAPGEREWLLESLANIRQRVREVEAEVAGLLELPILPVPDVRPDPRDGPAELRAKHNLLASRARDFDAVVEEIDDRLEALERRLRRDRVLQDQEAGLARFDDLRIAARAPAPAGQPRADGMSGESGEIGMGELPLEEQIALLRLFRQQAEELREETRAQAEEFQRRLPPPGGGR